MTPAFTTPCPHTSPLGVNGITPSQPKVSTDESHIRPVWDLWRTQRVGEADTSAVGYPTANGATEAAACTPARAPAVALVDGRGEVVRLTETFRDGFAADGSTHGSVWDLIADAEQRLLLNGVLEGRLLRVDLALPTATGSVTVQAEAVVDMAVTRHALLTVCSAAPDPGRRAGAEALLGDPSVDDSQAIVWIKDLDGRYLRVNRRYSEALGIDDARIRGKTDAELSPAAVVDGRRPGEHGGDDAEPVQLEYTVEAAGGRTALTVLRFPVRDLDGAPVAVCRVAAPATEAGIARSEAERLLRIERWARLSTAAIRAELIEEWQLAEVPAPPPVAAADGPAGPGPATGVSAAELAQARAELAAERAARVDLEARLGEASTRIAELDEALAAAARRAEELVDAGTTAAGVAGQVEAERSIRAELERRLAQALREAVDAGRRSAAQEAQAERAKAAAELSRARAEGLETTLASARQTEAESRTALAQARAEIVAERAGKAELETRVGEASARIAEQQEALAAAARRAAELVDAEATDQGQVAALETAREAERGRADGAERELAAVRGRVAELEAARTTTAAAAGQAESERSIRAELERRLAQALRHAVDAERSSAAERAQAAQARDELIARTEQAETATELSRARAEGLETALASARDAEAESRAALARARANPDTAREATARLDRERHELADHRPATMVVTEPLAQWPFVRFVSTPVTEDNPSASGPVWSPRAQRALTASLAGASEWRTGLKDAVRILGSDGGWAAVVAWCAEDRAPALRCAAMWTSLPDQLGQFETATWQGRQSLATSEVGRTTASRNSRWLAELETVDDAHIRAAAEAGMRAALLVAIQHDAKTVGVLELLTRASVAPDSEIALATEAVALQLAHFEYLLRRGAEPHWRLGRL
jgi:PAS domain-containing protein